MGVCIERKRKSGEEREAEIGIETEKTEDVFGGKRSFCLGE